MTSSSPRWRSLVHLLTVTLALVRSLALACSPSDTEDSYKWSIKDRNTHEDGVGMPLFEGDIALTEIQKQVLLSEQSSTVAAILDRAKRSLSRIHQTWSDAIVPYRIDSLLDTRYQVMFIEAVRIIENVTCIHFIPRTEQENYLVFYVDNGEKCSSYVGAIGGPQRVTLADSCATVGRALHELGHALGLWHEHSRPDRDNYIDILFENLKQREDRVHFRKISTEMFKHVPDVGYDLESIMHYSPFAFAKTSGLNLRTILLREDADLEELNCINRLPMGQRKQLSYKDKRRLNVLYQCRDVNIVRPICLTKDMIANVEETTPPTAVTPSITTSKPLKLDIRLRTRNYLTIRLIEEHGDSGKVHSTHGMECSPSPGCIPVPCLESACESIPNLFQIIKTNEDSGGRSIRSGTTVVVRSIHEHSNFLDCGNQTNPTDCVVSECRRDNNVVDLNSPGYISSCYEHKFEIWGVKRPKNEILNTSNKIQFKKSNSNSYLSCNGK